MRTIGYIRPTARYPAAQQRKVVGKVVLDDERIMSDPQDCDFVETVRVLDRPGDMVVVPKMSVISRERRVLDRLVSPLLERGVVVLEAETNNRVTDVESFRAGLWAAQRKGQSRKKAQAAAAKSKGRSIAPIKLNEAKKIWRNPAYKNVHDAAKKAGVSVSTMHRHFGRRFAIKDPELE